LLLCNQYPACNNREIRTALAQSAEDKGTSGRDNSYGWGIVDYHADVTYLTTNNACAAGPASPSASLLPAPPLTGAPSNSPTEGGATGGRSSNTWSQQCKLAAVVHGGEDCEYSSTALGLVIKEVV